MSTSITVPDEVAAMLEQITSAKPKEDPDIADKQYVTLGTVKAMIAALLPPFSAADNGKVLGVSGGVLAWIEDQTGATVTQTDSELTIS